MIAEQDRLLRAQLRYGGERMKDAPGARDPDEAGADQEARYKGRVELYASQAVRSLLERWIDIFTEGWAFGTEFSRYQDDFRRLGWGP